jgi:hypothetical protein
VTLVLLTCHEKVPCYKNLTKTLSGRPLRNCQDVLVTVHCDGRRYHDGMLGFLDAQQVGNNAGRLTVPDIRPLGSERQEDLWSRHSILSGRLLLPPAVVPQSSRPPISVFQWLVLGRLKCHV